MPSDCLSYRDSGFFSPLIVDYLNQEDKIRPLYNRFPTLENFAQQIAEKRENFKGDRTILADVLLRQYESIDAGDAVRENIELLRKGTTFTIITGHQLNLFTGPLYFLYKIVSTVNLCKTLQSAYPENNFVPVYWMATEDHDFDEINHFTYKGKKVKWEHKSGGAVGRFDTNGLDKVRDQWAEMLGESTNAKQLLDWFDEAYLKHSNLADATRYLAHKLFGDTGLIIIDADDRQLKQQFAPYVKDELTHHTSAEAIAQTTEILQSYGLQVNPREINLFYLDEGIRERIIEIDGGFGVNNTSLRFTTDEILKLVESSPEKFSPNVVMRPLYQEVILPNLCYIGGGGELAYWLQLKPLFEKSNIAFPVLLLRNSAMIATRKQLEKADKLGLSWRDLFQSSEKFKNILTQRLTNLPLDFTPQKQHLIAQFDALEKMAVKTDRSFASAVAAQKAKQLKGLDNLEKKLLRAEKRRHADILARACSLKEELFPGGGLQERKANFAEFYKEYGSAFLQILQDELLPLESDFKILVL
jgi:bacillithiol biosynthesis cysteine-adding enzyme BshC